MLKKNIELDPVFSSQIGDYFFSIVASAPISRNGHIGHPFSRLKDLPKWYLISTEDLVQFLRKQRVARILTPLTITRTRRSEGMVSTLDLTKNDQCAGPGQSMLTIHHLVDLFSKLTKQTNPQ